MMTKTKNYWLAAYTKGGAPIMHHCVPVLVMQSPLDIEIRRAKK